MKESPHFGSPKQFCEFIQHQAYFRHSGTSFPLRIELNWKFGRGGSSPLSSSVDGLGEYITAFHKIVYGGTINSTMSDHLNIESLAADDSTRIIDLINSIQPAIPWTPRYLHWQYFESPAGPARLYGIRHSGKLISLYAAVPHRFRFINRTLTARMVQDVMTAPEYRGRGYLHELAKRCLQDIISSGEVGFTFPNQSSEKSFRRTGWTELCFVPWRKKELSSMPTQPPDQSIAIASVEAFGVAESGIWESSAVRIGVQKDAAYLNWRYSKPGNTYFKFTANRDEGFVVLKIYNDGTRRILHICELLLRADTRGHLSDVLLFCERFAFEHGASLMTAWLTECDSYSQSFTAAGFSPVQDSGRYVFVHPGQQPLAPFIDLRLWHLSQGDSDIY